MLPRCSIYCACVGQAYSEEVLGDGRGREVSMERGRHAFSQRFSAQRGRRVPSHSAENYMGGHRYYIFASHRHHCIEPHCMVGGVHMYRRSYFTELYTLPTYAPAGSRISRRMLYFLFVPNPGRFDNRTFNGVTSATSSWPMYSIASSSENSTRPCSPLVTSLVAAR